jgi:hypothetical protein
MSEITKIIHAIEAGVPRAAPQLLPLVYDELRRLAAQRLAQGPKPARSLFFLPVRHLEFTGVDVGPRRVTESDCIRRTSGIKGRGVSLLKSSNRR